MRNEKGFTLIEIVMVIVLIGILAAIAIPRYLDLTTQAQNATARGVLGSLRSANAIITANNAVGGTAAAWDITTVVGSAQLQGLSTSATGAASFAFQIGNATYTFTLAPAGPTVGNPGTIAAATATW